MRTLHVAIPGCITRTEGTAVSNSADLAAILRVAQGGRRDDIPQPRVTADRAVDARAHVPGPVARGERPLVEPVGAVRPGGVAPTPADRAGAGIPPRREAANGRAQP